MKKSLKLLITIALLSLAAGTISGQLNSRKEIKIPDIAPYLTLKGDLHMHTVFSDGNVWPTIRAEEAWREGLDVIAITDHIEYQPHKHDIPTKHNRSYEIANWKGNDLGILVIHGSEITRSMPPGHSNAIFIDDSEKLDTTEWMDAFTEAKKQDAFVFWNHPGWRGQRPDGIPRWYDEHTSLLEKGLFQGIEVVNEYEYYPIAHQWCIDKNLTMVSNSDIHNPIQMDYDMPNGEHRPVTLIFAESKTRESVKKALMERRTALYWEKYLIGDQKFLEPIFKNSIKFNKTCLELIGKERENLQIHNNSDISYELELLEKPDSISAPEKFTIHADRTVLFRIGSNKNTDIDSGVNIKYRVNNLYVLPEKGMEYTFNFNLKVTKKEEKK